MTPFSVEVQTLLDEVQHDNTLRQVSALKKLLALHTDESLRALRLVLDDVIHLHPFPAIVQHLAKHDMLDPLAYLREQLEKPLSPVGRNLHMNVLMALKFYHDEPETLDILTDFLFTPPQHTSGRNRGSAAYQLGTIGTEAALYRLSQALATQRDLPSRRGIINGFVKSRQRRAHQILLQMMDDLLGRGLQADYTVLDIGSDIAAGIGRLILHGVQPPDTSYAVQVLTRWLYLSVYPNAVLQTLRYIPTREAQAALQDWQHWRDTLSERKDNGSIFR